MNIPSTAQQPRRNFAATHLQVEIALAASGGRFLAELQDYQDPTPSSVRYRPRINIIQSQESLSKISRKAVKYQKRLANILLVFLYTVSPVFHCCPLVFLVRPQHFPVSWFSVLGSRFSVLDLGTWAVPFAALQHSGFQLWESGDREAVTAGKKSLENYSD